MIPLSALPLTPLADALLTGASATGLRSEQAAVSLLIGHRRWLDRDDFARFIHQSGQHPDTSAIIDWNALNQVLTALEPAANAVVRRIPWPGHFDINSDAVDPPASRSSLAILRLACSIASGETVDLRTALEGLDVDNTVLVLSALNHVAGHAEGGQIEVRCA